MPKDAEQLIRRSENAIRSTKQLCAGTVRAIERSKRLLEDAESSPQSSDGDARKRHETIEAVSETSQSAS